MASPAALPSDVDALPRRFGRYVLFDKIGEGGMARIFLARASTELGGERLLVVKEMLPMLASSEEMSRLLVEEAKLCATLTHKNIVQVYDLGRDENRLYIAMEYVEGLDLRELLRGCSQKKVPLPVEFSLFIVEETIRALDYAHRKRNDEGVPLGIVHRDISPSNVLLSVEGEVKLCDFGIARALTSGALLPEDAIQGKAGYMSPEAARGDGVDARSDVFAVGILLWELLAGQRLYRTGGDRSSVIEQAREAVIPPLPTRGYPDEARLAAIVARALARDPDARFPSAHAMLDEVETYVREHRFGASALRFGDWLVEHFGGELVALRRERERAATDLGTEFAAPEGLPSVPASRAELPTLPDPNAEERSALRQKIVEPVEPPHRRPSTAFIVILVVLFLIAGAIVSLFFGRR